MDTHQAIYDAVRSKISGGNVGEVVADAAREAFGQLSFLLPHAQQEIYSVSHEMQRPSVLYRPTIAVDGNKWFVLYGDDLQSGVAGFGDSPAEAMADFDKSWVANLLPRKTKAEA